MIRLITGIPARMWGWIILAAGLAAAGLKLFAMGQNADDVEERDAEDETRNRMDEVNPADSRDAALDSLRERDKRD